MIGICTRSRNDLLLRLLETIQQQPVPPGHDVSLLIVDNNDRPQVAATLDHVEGPFPIDVVHEPRTGLVPARNRALDEAVKRAADWFIGVDDDEWVAANWLAQMIEGMQALKRPILLGPVIFEYDETLSPYLQPKRIVIKEKGRRPSVYQSGNMALHCEVFDPAFGPGMRFNEALNSSGGEDTEFFLRAQRQYGWVPASWPDAVAYEDWNGARATLRYALHYEWRVRATSYRIAWLHCRLGLLRSRLPVLQQAFGRLIRNAVYGVIGLVVGLSLFAFWPDQARQRVGQALLRGAGVAGILSFFLGIPVRTYIGR